MSLIAADATVAVVGLGYVGLPRGRRLRTPAPHLGFDIDAARVDELRDSDRTPSRCPLTSSRPPPTCASPPTLGPDLSRRLHRHFVPTPIDAAKRPDLRRWSPRAARSAAR